jgi:hypothetical protein
VLLGRAALPVGTADECFGARLDGSCLGGVVLVGDALPSVGIERSVNAELEGSVGFFGASSSVVIG